MRRIGATILTPRSAPRNRNVPLWFTLLRGIVLHVGQQPKFEFVITTDRNDRVVESQAVATFINDLRFAGFQRVLASLRLESDQAVEQLPNRHVD